MTHDYDSAIKRVEQHRDDFTIQEYAATIHALQGMKAQDTRPIASAGDDALTPTNHDAAGVQDIYGLHSNIDMDIEDEIGRELTLEESRIVGLAIRKALKQ